MKSLWKPLPYPHALVLPTAPRVGAETTGRTSARRAAATPKPTPPMLRWRELVRAGLLNG